MRVTNIADACVLFEFEGVRLLADPWIGTPTNGYWLQYPPPILRADEIGPLDWIFISHLHEDHCDFATLAHLDPDARILIMERKPNLLFAHLVNHGVAPERISIVPPRQRLELAAGFSVEPLEPNPDHEYSRLVDSALLLHADNQTVYFANDAEPWSGTDQYIADNFDVGLALLPFYGGSGYPACYTNLTRDEQLSEVARIQGSYLASVERCLRTIQPRAVTPVASWHCFGGRMATLNPVMSWPESAHQLEEFMSAVDLPRTRLQMLLPGQGLDVPTMNRIGGDFVHFSADERQQFAETHLQSVRPRYEQIPNSPSIRLDRIFELASVGLVEKCRYDFPKGFRYAFEPDDQYRYVLDPVGGSTEILPLDSPLDPPFLRVSLDRRLFALLMIGAFSWNLEDASGLLRYERVPNTYHPEMFVALNYLKI